MRQLKITESITNRANRSLNSYLQEVGKYSVLTAEEEVVLAERIRNGDKVALNRLVNGNLRFVISVAKQYQNQGLVLEDLINEGNLGLVKAAGRFDETKGFKFISYAVWWIRQSIIAAIATQSRIVRLPGNQVADLIRLRRSQSALEQELEREPTPDELAEALGITVEHVKRSLGNAERQVSIDAPSVVSPDISLLDSLADGGAPTDHGAMGESLGQLIRDVLKTLPRREQFVLTLFYGLGGEEPKTLDEIGGFLGLTTERIRQVKEKALMRLKRSKRGSALFAHLD